MKRIKTETISDNLVSHAIERGKPLAHIESFDSAGFTKETGKSRINTVFPLLSDSETTDIAVEKKIKNLTFGFCCVRKEWLIKMNTIKRKRRF